MAPPRDPEDFEYTTSDPEERAKLYSYLEENGFEEDGSVLNAQVSGGIPALDMAPSTSRENYAQRAEEELLRLKKEENRYLQGATKSPSLGGGDVLSTVFTSVLPTLLGAALAGRKGAYAGAQAGLAGAGSAVAGLGAEAELERKRQQLLASSVGDDIKAKRAEVEKQKDASIDFKERAALQAQRLGASSQGTSKLASALSSAFGGGGGGGGQTSSGGSGPTLESVKKAVLRVGGNPDNITAENFASIAKAIGIGQKVFKDELSIKKEQMGDTARNRAFTVAGDRFVPVEVSPDQAEKIPALVDAYNGALAGLNELQQFAKQSTYGGMQRAFSPNEKDYISKTIDRVRTQLKNIQTARDQSRGTGTDPESLAARERLVPDMGSFWTEVGSGIGRFAQLSADIPSQVNNAINIIQQEAKDTLKGYGYAEEAVRQIPQGRSPQVEVGQEYDTPSGKRVLKAIRPNGDLVF